MNNEWICYKKGSEPINVFKVIRDNNVWKLTVKDLYDILVSHDIYIYFVEDKPKLMIYVLDGKKINGVFGYGEGNRIEDEYLEVLKKQLLLFKSTHDEIGTVNNLIKLAPIYKKYQNDEELTVDELKFIYQVDGPVNGFTLATDEKIEEIVESRDALKDLSAIFEVDEALIALDEEDIDEDTVVYVGNLDITSENVSEIAGLKHVIGTIYIDDKNLRKDIHVISSYGIEIVK